MSGRQIGRAPQGMELESPISSGARPGHDDWKPPAEFDEYRLVRPLGRGSMGQVFLAHDRVLDRPVAIKFISSLHASSSERERFLVEARAAARLHHPNIMAIHRVGELDGKPYLVCEYIRGKSLNELELPVSWQQAYKMAIGLARGLANAHRHGVLHRDVKLANVMVVDGEVKILDFSLAKLIRGRRGSASDRSGGSGARPTSRSTRRSSSPAPTSRRRATTRPTRRSPARARSRATRSRRSRSPTSPPTSPRSSRVRPRPRPGSAPRRAG